MSEESTWTPPPDPPAAADYPTIAVEGLDGPSVSFQLISDVHTEFPNFKPHKLVVPVNAPILVMAGDIGWPTDAGYKTFVHEQASRFKVILIIAGNHEFYGGEYFSRHQAIRDVAASAPQRNVHVLDRSGAIINGVLFLGTTLWTHVPKENEVEIQRFVNDYRSIKVDETATGADAPGHSDSEAQASATPLRVHHVNALHAKDVAWLQAQLAANAGRRVVVVTHHVPTMECTNPKDNHIRSAFHTDLSALIGPPAKVWCFGHTHMSYDVEINGTRVISNQVGYAEEYKYKASKYQPDLVITVDA
eukprot:NODE_1179_length_1045_cov_584.161647_g813_i0.p2 GENE.NODE_1179_length_1045_cov_584.161647_g813_i0~~NODE_1179_length_1045_cov_584.161647_g813_i0.p2  ORF type:complete len:321 (-),score=116.83 NODE_1179_length_1045_cov_584.161647_g813_i0:81-992(-)